MAPTSSRDHITRGSTASATTTTTSAANDDQQLDMQTTMSSSSEAAAPAAGIIDGPGGVVGGRRRGGGVPPVKLTEEQTLRFIELYREHECLWNTRSSEYRINRSRELAIESLRRRMGRVGGGGVLSMGRLGAGQLMSADAVKKKINCLRTAFKQEHDKVLAKKCRSGSSGGEVYTPRLTWYNAFLFIRDYMVQRTSSASVASKSESTTASSRSSAKSIEVNQEMSNSTRGGGGNNVTIRWKNHADILAKGVTEFFRKQYLVDTDVSIRGETLKTHKMILALFLPTFKKSVDDVKGQLHGLNLDYVANGTEDVRALIEFVYTGTVSVAKDRLGHLGRLAECLKFEGLSRAIRQLCDTATAAVVSDDGAASNNNNNNRPENTNRSILDTVLADGNLESADLIDQDTVTGDLDLPVEAILGANNDQEYDDNEEEEEEEEEQEEEEEEYEGDEDEMENDEDYCDSDAQLYDDDDDDEDNVYDDDEGTDTLQNYPVETVLVENYDQNNDKPISLQSAVENDFVEDEERVEGQQLAQPETSSLRIGDVQGTFRRSSRVLRSYRRRSGMTCKTNKLVVCKDMFAVNTNNNNNNVSGGSLQMTKADYFRQWRTVLSTESRDARLASQARLMRERRASESKETRQQRLQREAAKVREQRSAETPEGRRIRRQNHAYHMRERRSRQSENSSQEPFPVQVSYYDGEEEDDDDDGDGSSSMDGTDIADPDYTLKQNSGFYISGT